MNSGDKVVWHTYRRDKNHNFITFDAIILSVGEESRRVWIEYLDRSSLFPQKGRREVDGARLMIRNHCVPELDV